MTRGTASATTRDERQPAELQQPSSTTSNGPPRRTPTARSGARTQSTIRQALIAKYDASYPASTPPCRSPARRPSADGSPLTTSPCPGNRRWDPADLRRLPAAAGLDPRCWTAATRSSPPTRCATAAPTCRPVGRLRQARHGRRRLSRPQRRAVETRGRLPRNPATPGANGAVRFRAVSADGSALPEEVNVYIGHYEARITPIVHPQRAARRSAAKPALTRPGT